MEGILISKAGTYQKIGQVYSGGNQSDLIFQGPGMEVVVDIMPKGTLGLLSPSENKMIEMYYVLSGKMQICDLDEIVTMTAGDFFCLHELKKHIMFRVLQDTRVLYINNKPYFDTYEEHISGFTQVLEHLQRVDGDTKNHCERVKDLCMGIAYFLRFDQEKLDVLFFAARFHDVGKSKISPEILLKPGKLTPEEFKIMQEHSQYTYEMIREKYGAEIAQAAYGHHERLDGTGYPRHLKGDEISMAARIICVADAYDAMVTSRPYHVGMTREAAVAELYRCVGTQFDETVIPALEKFLDMQDEE